MRLPIVLAVCVLSSSFAHAQEGPPLTPKTLEAALSARPQGVEADRLAERIRAYFGGSEGLVKGSAAPKIDELTVAWAVEVPQLAADAPPPRVVSDARLDREFDRVVVAEERIAGEHRALRTVTGLGERLLEPVVAR